MELKKYLLGLNGNLQKNRSKSLLLTFLTFFIDFKTFLTVDPNTISEANPAVLYNLINGQWKAPENYTLIPDPYNGEAFIKVPDTKTPAELAEFKENMELCTKSGLHNPIKNPERYLLYGTVLAKAAALLTEVKPTFSLKKNIICFDNLFLFFLFV